jgi:hypothetical protein
MAGDDDGMVDRLGGHCQQELGAGRPVFRGYSAEAQEGRTPMNTDKKG